MSFGEQIQNRARILLEALLDYDQQEHSDRFQQILKADLRSSKKSKRGYRREQQLTFHVSLRQQGARRVVKATLYSLERLPKVFGKDALTKYQVEAAIDCLKKFDILENLTTRGATERELILKYKDRDEVLRQFEEACKRWEGGKRRNNKNSHVDEPAPTSISHMAAAPVPSATVTELPNAIALPDWHKICRDRLHAQEQQRLTTNQLTFKDGMAYELDDIPLNLGLVERKKAPKIHDEISPERSIQPSEYEIGKKFKYSEFLNQVLSTQQQGNATKKTRIAIIGEPGAGKTTLLQKIAFEVDKNGGLPIVVSLGDLRGRNLRQYLLEDWLVDAVPRRITQDVEDDFVEQFNQGRVWLLLDGVDEMATGSLSALDDLKQQLASSFVARARVVLTCRLNVWDSNLNALETFETYRTLEVSYPEQVGQFIDSWFKTIDPERGQRLKTALAQPEKKRIQDLIKNPLRLALLCRTWQREEGDLPDTKGKLYQQFVDDLYWWKWKYEGFRTTKPQRQELKAKLGQLARDAIAQDSSRFRLLESSIYPLLGNRHEENSLFSLACKLGLLIPIGKAAEDTAKWVYAFFHPTFQEYFAACAIDNWNYFLNHIPDNPPPDGYRIFEPQWKEVFLLWLGRDGEEDEDKEKLINQKEALIKALVTFEDGWENFYHFRAYFLAAAGIAEFQDCRSSDGIRDVFLIMYAEDYLEESGFDETLSHAIVESAKKFHYSTDANVIVSNLARLGLHSYKLYISSDWCKTIGFCVAEEARLVLEETDRVRAIALLACLIQSIQAEALQTYAVEILGKIGISHETAIKALEWQTQNTQDEIRCWEAAENLGKIDPTNKTARKVLRNLVEKAQHEHIRSAAAWSLGKIDPGNKIAIKALIKIIKTPQEGHNRKRAALNLGEIDPGNEEATNFLLSMLNTAQDKNIRFTAAENLGRVDPDNKLAIEELENMTQDESICQSVAESLGEIDPGNIIAIKSLEDLIQKAPPEHEFYRQFVASYLAKLNLGNEIAIEAFKLIIKNTNDELKLCRAAMSLGQMNYSNETNKIATDALVRYIQTAKYNSMVYGFAESFKAILRGEQGKKVVRSLKSYLINPSYRNGVRNEMDRFLDCYNILWYCAQNMSYPEFYHAWYG